MNHKDQIDKELSGGYRTGNFLAYLMSRKWGLRLFNFFMKGLKGKKNKNLENKEQYIPSNHGGLDIRIRIYKPKNTQQPLPVMLYLHGGGYSIGVPEMVAGIENFIQKRPCVVVAPDYRKSIKNPYPSALNDCYDVLLWIENNTALIGGNGKIIVAGESAGGGLTAAITLKNRDQQDVDIAFQMPLYPMLDYRQNTTSAKTFIDTPVWNARTSKLGWELYLKDLTEKNTAIPEYASPALATNYNNLPPTITFVGDLDPFKDETIFYVNNLKKAGVATAFQQFPNAFHAFEVICPKAAVSKKALHFLWNAYADFYDQYCI